MTEAQAIEQCEQLELIEGFRVTAESVQERAARASADARDLYRWHLNAELVTEWQRNAADLYRMARAVREIEGWVA